MPAITITDLENAKADVDHLAAIANSTALTATDRLGRSKRTVAGMNDYFEAQLADAESDLNVYRADAAASASQALGYLNVIRATSYGAYASDPITDPLGNPPTVGDEYFNTTANLLKRWNGSTWQASDINTANLASAGGSALVGYQPSGTVAVATTVQSRIDSLAEGNTESIAPAYVETLSTGLVPSTPANVSATLAVNVTGTAGSAVLTTTDTALVAGFGSTTAAFAAALISADGKQMFFATVVGNNGSTQITLRRPLTANFTGVLSPKYNAALGQHLSENGTRAYAQHVANQTGLMCSRGRIMDGAWLDGPSSLQTAWVRNAALIAYGVVNSASPVVQTSFSNLSSAMNIIGPGVREQGPHSLAQRGVSVGTHLSGHGLDGVFYGRGKNVVLEFWTAAERSTTELPNVTMAVSVSNNGTVVYTATSDASLWLHRVPIMDAGKINVSITNTDGSIYKILVMQNTLREAGADGRLIKPHHKVVCLGDSWFEFYSGLFAATLQSITGATVINRALGGQTTEWALSWFDAYVAAEKPDVCIFHFFTNDSNNLSANTFTTPTGGTLPKWPSGLTDDQSQAHWRSNLNKLVMKCQALGIRPVIINAGGTASESQMQKHANWSWALDRSTPVDWVATAAQLSDSTSFINNFGKQRGVVVSVGEAIKYASGPLNTDAWTNPMDNAFIALQKKTLKRTDYQRTASFSLGIDGNADGVSDGLTVVPWGTSSTLGETLTPSVTGGAQRYTYTFVSGNTGNKRLRYDFSLEAGKDYIFIFEVANGSSDFSMDFVENVSTGSYVVPSETSSKRSLVGGVGPLWARVTAADTMSNRGVGIAPSRSDGTTRSMDVTAAYCIDLAAMFVDAPNAATLKNAELVAFVRGIQP